MEHLILHQDPISANCYKISLTAALLSIPLEHRSYSIMKGETRTPEFLENVSAYGRIPVLQIGGSTFLPESNAACFYLAEKSSSSSNSTSSPTLIPDDPLLRAEMFSWMFFEQNQHEVNIATLRFWLHVLGEKNLDGTRRVQVDGKVKAGKQVLDYMNDHLAKSEHGWFVGENITLADICLFAYTHIAHHSGFNLDEWPAVQKWCERVKGVRNFVPFTFYNGLGGS
ncbi:uncharacterized protein Z518_03880 [Rhinocladiella mackenziei CBS 650.93]|uniref:Glutathione S-transferase n=1 Tax=Rhinocladiella mackenziei CBS 650.93 TaxID=1442369 RepID=A0A0D2IRZ1_9EURO|nr:uncharacterized protein Z518_03880 [Rhinocladiella mackenziei CBS 650.93]KIX05906.1 hypothetical protein Z518_03880 [Rhinocladiella mackenziei CBS 650.93]